MCVTIRQIWSLLPCPRHTLKSYYGGVYELLISRLNFLKTIIAFYAFTHDYILMYVKVQITLKEIEWDFSHTGRKKKFKSPL